MTSPTNKKAPAPTKTQNAFITSTDTCDYPTALPCSKAILRAHFAEAGYVVHEVTDGYVVIRADWGLSVECQPELTPLRQFFSSKFDPC